MSLLTFFLSMSLVLYINLFKYQLGLLAINTASAASSLLNIVAFYWILSHLVMPLLLQKKHPLLIYLGESTLICFSIFFAALTNLYLVQIPIFQIQPIIDTIHLFYSFIFYAIPSLALGAVVSELKHKQINKSTLPFLNWESSGTLIISLLTSALSLYALNTYKQWLTNYAINFISIFVYVINIYLFYQVFDALQSFSGYNPKLRRSKFFFEFLKIVVAFFIAGFINFNFISKPIFGQNFDPNYLFIILIFSLPSAAIALIISELRQVKEIAFQLRIAQAEAQYNLLETQMQPHFLFNSLNVLSELIYVDPDLASSMTQKLADLYREILTNSKRKFSDLGSEISILEKYIEIQKIRFGSRVRFHLKVPPQHRKIMVPSLILQTLVENAIKHGISPSQAGGDITLSSHEAAHESIQLKISNTGKLYDPQNASKSKGTGLQNTKNRLDLIYGAQHSFQIENKEDRQTLVQFSIPKTRELGTTIE